MISSVPIKRATLILSAIVTAPGCGGHPSGDLPIPGNTTGTGVVVGFPREKVDFKEMKNGEPVGRLSVGDSVSFYLRYNPNRRYAPLDQVLDTARNLTWSVWAANGGSGAFGDELATIQTRDAGRGVLIARAAATTVEVSGKIGGEYYGESTVLSCVGAECIRVMMIIR